MNLDWQAIYKDGEVINGGSSAKLDRSRLESIALVADEDEKVRINGDNARHFFYRRRVKITQGRGEEVCHILGYDNGCDKLIHFVHEKDGKVETVKEFNENHTWFYSPRFGETDRYKETVNGDLQGRNACV